jgi:hypothetical protein
MGYEAKKTEHSGPKRGNGAYWGYKWEAKKESNRIRRENAKREVSDGGNEESTSSQSSKGCVASSVLLLLAAR